MQELFGYITVLAIFIAIIGLVVKLLSKLKRPAISSADASQLQATQAIPQSYDYERRDLIMTRAENNFFKMLDEAIGDRYYIFPQVHLSSLFEHKVHGQDWWKAFHHINRKSVDFVICDRQTVRPLAAIELDDWSHKLEKRKLRDTEVERIFKGANFPLLRFGSNGNYTPQSISATILESDILK